MRKYVLPPRVGHFIISFPLVHIICHYIPCKPKIRNLAFPLINGYKMIIYFFLMIYIATLYELFILYNHAIHYFYRNIPEKDLSPFVSTKIFLAARSLWITFFDAKNAIPFAI